MTPKVFYRALFTRIHRQRWDGEQYTSFHQLIPGTWIQTWCATGSLNSADYSLACNEGVFTANARQAFLGLAPKYSFDAALPPSVVQPAGELAGICAFTNPAAAYRYGIESWCGDAAQFVEFEGELLFRAPEDDGVVARVDRALGLPMSAAAFRTKHGLPE